MVCNRKVILLILIIVFVISIGFNIVTGITKENGQNIKIVIEDNKKQNNQNIKNKQSNEKKENIIKNNKPIKIDLNSSLGLINYDIKSEEENFIDNSQIFPKTYTEIEGIITFRGNNFRNTASFGKVDIKENKLEKIWSFTTKSRSFGPGAGWTGQPSIIKWPEKIKKIMNIKDKFKNKENFIEVIYASLDGRVYFFDLETGEQTRKPIDMKKPIKGSVSIDPRGYPLLYVGQGIPDTKEIGYKIFSLINGEQLYFINGRDEYAFRKWGAFDGSALINKYTDTLILGGENGIFYKVKLNTKFDIENKQIIINPIVTKYRYKILGNRYQGIENSVVAYKNLVYFADNGGGIQCIDLITMQPLWVWYDNNADDTNASLTLELEKDVPYLYVGTEQDKQGTKGYAYFKKN